MLLRSEPVETEDANPAGQRLAVSAPGHYIGFTFGPLAFPGVEEENGQLAGIKGAQIFIPSDKVNIYGADHMCDAISIGVF